MAVVVIAGAVIGGAAVPANAAARATPITKAKATAVATRINFHASDFPGYSVTPYQPSAAEKAEDKRTEKCVGAAPEPVNVSSSAFSDSSGNGYSSETDFVASIAAAKQDAKLAKNAHSQQCLDQELEAATTAAGASDPKSTLTPITETPVAGLDAFFGYQITITFTVLGQQSALYGYDIGFARGNAEVTFEEIGATNLPQSATRQPLAVLISRAKQQVPAAGLPIKHS
jgi:hypothetical protein